MSERIVFRSGNLDHIKPGELRAKFSASGDRILRYYVDVRHTALDLHKELSAPEVSILQNKVDVLMIQWDKQYDAFKKREELLKGKELADNLVRDAELRRENIKNTLKHTLTVDDTVDWGVLKSRSKFHRQEFGAPPEKQSVKLPMPSAARVGFFKGLLGARRRADLQYKAAMAAYVAEEKRVARKNADALTDWKKRKAAWDADQDAKEAAFLEQQANQNAKVDELEVSWHRGVPEAIEEHAAIVLEASEHDSAVPKQWDIEYKPESKMLFIEYVLPSPDDLPLVKSVKFMPDSGERKISNISERDRRSLFDDYCFQICLRTLHELFEADTLEHIESIAFNGRSSAIDPRNGRVESAIIISVAVSRSDFLEINLQRVDPRACFKSIKGVSAASLVGITPIAPVIDFEKSDKRFVDGREVEVARDGSTNLAAMGWEEFEHLVRELFEKEFASRGGEVRVTQSSNDGGVDAIAFDPDPISGGKIIIQAKRYTRTVGVAAVRDLYGTTLNEGAIKGILVTTSDYGPDAYKFASDKPLTLMTGSHLLHLLGKHGVNAKIDLKEARAELGLRG